MALRMVALSRAGDKRWFARKGIPEDIKRIAALRAKQRGEGRPLTRLNAIALAARWYNWFIKRMRMTQAHLSAGRHHFIWKVLHPKPQTATSRTRRLTRMGSGPEHLRSARPQVAELARVATFLASAGVAL